MGPVWQQLSVLLQAFLSEGSQLGPVLSSPCGSLLSRFFKGDHGHDVLWDGVSGLYQNNDCYVQVSIKTVWIRWLLMFKLQSKQGPNLGDLSCSSVNQNRAVSHTVLVIFMVFFKFVHKALDLWIKRISTITVLKELNFFKQNFPWYTQNKNIINN